MMRTACAVSLMALSNRMVPARNGVGRAVRNLLCAMGAVMLCCACAHEGATDTRRAAYREVDSLNAKAYEWRYTHRDSSLFYAREAEKVAGELGYRSGLAEALVMRMFFHVIDMDFDGVRNLYRRVQDCTDNEIALLAAEINMMMICQMSSQNRPFFDYQNRALQRINRIEEDRELLDERDVQRFGRIRAGFRFVTAMHYVDLMQIHQAENEFERIDHEDVRNDRSALVAYRCVQGLIASRLPRSMVEDPFKAFDRLLQAYSMAERNGYVLLESVASNLLSGVLLKPSYWERMDPTRKGRAELVLNELASGYQMREDTLQQYALPALLARHSLACAEQSGNLLLVSDAHVAMGNVHFVQEEYRKALGCYEKALSCLNRHHRTFYPDDRSILRAGADDTTAVDMQWASDTLVQTVPARLTVIRERLSATYSALSDKRNSDYNRNLYLDLLDFTRQDKSWESLLAQVRHDNLVLHRVLVAVLLLSVLIAVLLAFYARMWRRRGEMQFHLLSSLYDWFMHFALSDDGGRQVDSALDTHPWMKSEDKLWHEMARPYVEWAEKNRTFSGELSDECEQLREDLGVSERKIAENKRGNIVRRAKMSLVHSVTPFLDRILHEVHRMKRFGEISDGSLEYIEELSDKIDAIGGVLSEWIQLTRGEVEIHTETFPLQELFSMVRKNEYAFRMKGLSLDVYATDIYVKTDRALTFFMLNTLVDNARKFTPEGGRVTVQAADTEDGAVEVSVTDTGCGLSQADIDLILSSKVYDAGRIGNGGNATEGTKGHGFGLLNCKGIIENFRKKGGIYQVCAFGIESRPGKGSRFSFRIPKGMARLCLLLGWWLLVGGFDTLQAGEIMEKHMPGECHATHADHLSTAVGYADSVYFGNIDGRYEAAIHYADSAFKYVNLHYADTLARHEGAMPLTRYGRAPEELDWWRLGIKADYDLILALRNEVAVAALALRDWSLYAHNNEHYIRLYRVLTQDTSIEGFYRQQRDVRTNLTVSIAFLILLALVSLVLVYSVYFRRRILMRANIMQVLAVNNEMLRLTDGYDREGRQEALVGNLLDTVLSGIRQMHGAGGLSLLLHKKEDGHGERFVCGSVPHTDLVNTLLDKAFQNKEKVADDLLDVQVYPLLLHSPGGESRSIGALAVSYGTARRNADTDLLESYVVSYLAILLYETVIQRDMNLADVEEAENRKRRALFEESRLYVQNRILDNCLSTIKHETMYYPSRIRQLAEGLKRDKTRDTSARVDALAELTGYYKQIYTLLSMQAERQLATVHFRPETVCVSSVVHRWERYAASLLRRRAIEDVLLRTQCDVSVGVRADAVLLDYLLERVTGYWMDRFPEVGAGDLFLHVTAEDGFARFALSTSATLFTAEACGGLFFPDAGHYAYLLSKEIIREHDKMNNSCGCRIEASVGADGRCTLWFTLPLTQQES